MHSSLNLWHISALAVIVALASQVSGAKDERECEVCISVLEKFKNSVDESIIKDVPKSEAAFQKFCNKLPKGGKENRFCYFIGATDDAATRLVNKVCQPLSYFMPPNKICQKLKTVDSQICELRFDKKPDFTKLQKMRVGELKKILSNWGEDNACKGCAEKSDFVKKIKELMPKYEPEEYKKLQKTEL